MNILHAFTANRKPSSSAVHPLVHRRLLVRWLSSAPRFDRRDCRDRFPGTQTASRIINVPLLRLRSRIVHLNIVITPICHVGCLPFPDTARGEVVLPRINQERESLAHEVAQSLSYLAV